MEIRKITNNAFILNGLELLHELRLTLLGWLYRTYDQLLCKSIYKCWEYGFIYIDEIFMCIEKKNELNYEFQENIINYINEIIWMQVY